MSEQIGAEAAAAANDDEAVNGSCSPNQASRWARDGCRVDSLKPSVEPHVNDHQYTGTAS